MSRRRTQPAPRLSGRTTFIYALLDPDTGAICYIGRAVQPDKRLADHLRVDLRNVFPSAKERWIRRLVAEGKEPVLKILDEVPIEHQREHERMFIELAIEAGDPLLNTAEP